jgi:hypothetical protein
MRCQECGRVADERAAGWRAFVAADDEKESPPVTLVY